MTQRTAEELEAGLDDIRCSPGDRGRVELIVRRPAEEQRELLVEAHIDEVDGLVGDNWRQRGSSSTDDGAANPDAQVTIMNVRAAALVAVDADRRVLAGDQLYVDFDLSHDNVPAGTRLVIGTAVLEASEHPHLGCHKFSARFGRDALKFVNSPLGRQLRLRGLNTRVVVPGVIRVGDEIHKLAAPARLDDGVSADLSR